MNIFSILNSRRSVRKFIDRDISNKDINKILDAARHAPYGGPPKKEGQIWDYIVVRDEEIKHKLALNFDDRQWIKKAPVIIGVCVDMSTDTKYNNWEIVAGLTMQNLIIAAHSLGIGTCVVSTFSRNNEKKEERAILRNILNIPLKYDFCSLITLGYPDPSEEIEEKEMKDLDTVIHFDKW